jgi:hypothetical protein
MVQLHKNGTDSVYRSTTAPTGDVWLCTISYTDTYVGVVVRCNTRTPITTFYLKSIFNHRSANDVIDRVLFHHYNVEGEWRWQIVVWLFQEILAFIDAYL